LTALFFDHRILKAGFFSLTMSRQEISTHQSAEPGRFCQLQPVNPPSPALLAANVADVEVIVVIYDLARISIERAGIFNT